MIIFVVIALIVVVVIFGISSGMQSYATAQQAQATIETARAAQMATFGNLLMILSILIVVLIVGGVLVYAMIRRVKQMEISKSAPRSHGEIYRRLAARPRNTRTDENYIVENLTSDQLDELTTDLLDMFED